MQNCCACGDVTLSTFDLTSNDLTVVDVQISGRMRAVMKPLVSQIPVIGAVTVFFLNKPVQQNDMKHFGYDDDDVQ